MRVGVGVGVGVKVRVGVGVRTNHTCKHVQLPARFHGVVEGLTQELMSCRDLE